MFVLAVRSRRWESSRVARQKTLADSPLRQCCLKQASALAHLDNWPWSCAEYGAEDDLAHAIAALQKCSRVGLLWKPTVSLSVRATCKVAFAKCISEAPNQSEEPTAVIPRRRKHRAAAA